MTRPDFVDVQLSAAGVAIAGAGSSIRIATQHFDYTFTAATPTNVLTSEWRMVLANEAVNGQKIFMLAPAVVLDVPQGESPAAQLAAVKAEETVLDAEIAPQSSDTQAAPQADAQIKPGKGSK